MSLLFDTYRFSLDGIRKEKRAASVFPPQRQDEGTQRGEGSGEEMLRLTLGRVPPQGLCVVWECSSPSHVRCGGTNPGQGTARKDGQRGGVRKGNGKKNGGRTH